MALSWYLIHSKPRQEQIALENLERQFYPCYLPIFRAEKIRRGELSVSEEPLFPRYLFVQLDTDSQSRSCAKARLDRLRFSGFSSLSRRCASPADLLREWRVFFRWLMVTGEQWFSSKCCPGRCPCPSIRPP